MRRICTQFVCIYFLMFVSFMLSSCADEDYLRQPVESSGLKVGLYAGGVQTRTEMLPNGLSAAWEDGDQLSVWAAGPSGSYTLSNQVFKTYGLDGNRGFFTSTLDSAMPEGTYTYYACYPVPASVNGTSVTFNIPAVQDGKASGGADIMIATPVSHGPLAPVPEPEDHSGMRMQMNRMMHQFRFWIPEEYTTLTEPVNEIIFTMPSPVTGTVRADVTSPDSGLSMTAGGSSTVTLTMSEGISASASLEDASFACAAICPSSSTHTDADYMNITLYSQKYKAVLDPISLAGRKFAPGHSTPVRLMPLVYDEYYRLTMNVRDNYIGEPLSNVTISFNGSPWYTYTNSADEGMGNFTHVVEALNADGKAAYDLIVSSIEGGNATYTYETEHALVERPLTADMMTYDGNKIVLELGDVPYLLYEDFTYAKETAHDDDYTASANSDRNYTGYILDDYMPQSGWNAARFKIFDGDCVRINCRYQSGAWIPERVCGRLDTPALKYIKSGVNVNVKVEFDYAFYVPAGFNRDDSASEQAHYILATHTNAEGTALNGENYGDIGRKSTKVTESGRYASGDVSHMNHASILVSSAASNTRVVFWAGTDRESKVIAANSVYYLYLDNIKVYIEN